MQAAHALLYPDSRQPAGGAVKFSDIAHIPALITHPPSPEGKARAPAVQCRDTVDQLEEAQRVFRSAADVEGLAGDIGQTLLGGQERVDEIIDEQSIAYLLAIAVKRDRLPVGGADHEMREPALVLGAVLMRPVDAAHAEDGGRKSIAARVIEDVLVGRPLRAAI